MSIFPDFVSKMKGKNKEETEQIDEIQQGKRKLGNGDSVEIIKTVGSVAGVCSMKYLGCPSVLQVLICLKPCSDERQNVLSCLILKQNNFKPLKQSMFTFTTKTF